MEIIYAKDYDDVSQVAKDILTKELMKNDNLILGLATGGTPEGLYKKLIEDKRISWKNVTTFNLDEYVGLESENQMSYRFYMNHKLFNHIDIDKENTFVPSGTGNLEKNIFEYDKLIEQKGGIDIQILGIGENGHIAFNEPGSDPTLGTNIVDLTISTIKANSKYFKDIKDVPKKAITMGIGQILKSKKIILLASGFKKASAIKNTIEGKVSLDVPASHLQNHPNTIIIVDQEASSLLNK